MASKTSHPVDRSGGGFATRIPSWNAPPMQRKRSLIWLGRPLTPSMRTAPRGGRPVRRRLVHGKPIRYPGGDGVQEFAHATADRLSSTAQYVSRNTI